MSKFVSFSCEMETLQQHMHGWVCEIPLIPLYLYLYLFIIPLIIHIDSRIGIDTHPFVVYCI